MSRSVASAREAGPIATAREFRPDIQGLRAVAVLLVVAYHAGLPISGGYIGVDVFFVISGFLITSHLLAEVSTTHRLDFGRFYARRARRILPASFVVLAGTVVGSVLILPPGLLRSIMQDAIATALYVPNMLFAWRGTDYLAETAPSPFQHYWSLGVEEQFYLIWPLALLGLWALVRRDRRWLAVATALIVLASFSVGVWLTATNGSWAFFSLPSRAWQLGVGSLLAIAGTTALARIPAGLAAALGWLGLAVIGVGALVFDSATPFPGVAALVPVLGAAALIASGVAASGWGPTVLLGTRPFQFIGAISYSLYLVHWPLVVLPTYLTGTLVELPVVVTTLLSLAGIPLAWLLYRWVETPARTSRALSSRRPRVTLLASLAASLVTVVVAAGAIVAVDNRPTSAGRDAAATVVEVPPVFTDFVPSNLTPSLADAPSDLPSLYADGCHLPFEDGAVQSCTFGDLSSDVDVVLFGDSHAAQWFPALERLADEQGFRLHAFTKSSCPSVDVPILVKNAPYLSCDSWRAGVVQRLAELEPALIVMSNFATYPDQGADGIRDEVWAAGLESMISAFPDDSRVALIADTPSFELTPPVCLSAHLTSANDCARPRAEALNAQRDAVETQTAQQVGAVRVDLTDELCDAQSCGPIIGSTLVYRDTHHLTATFAGLLASRLGQDLLPLLVD